jgi:hypothetical protein
LAMRAACTIVAKPWIAHARVLARSFAAYHPHIPVFALLADEASTDFDAVREPYRVIDIRTLDIPHFEQFRFRYGQQPLTYATTPYLLAHLLKEGFDQVLFFKQESLVLGSHEEVFELLDRHDVVLTPHHVSKLSGDDAIARELNILHRAPTMSGCLGCRTGRPLASS